MEIENLNLYHDSAWNDIKIRFCGHSECLPLHTYGPGSRPYYLLHFVLSGRGKLIVNKTTYQISAGQLFLVEPNQMVYYQADKTDPWTYAWVGFNGGLSEHFMRRLGLTYPSLIRKIDASKFNNIQKLLQEILEITVDNTEHDLYINGLFLLLLSKISKENNSEQSVLKSNINSTKAYVREAIGIIEDFYGTNLTVEVIAKKLNINRSYLSSIFKQQIGTPLKKYLVDFRISQSEEFLFTTNWSVDYISNLCGFNNPSYFSKTFKNYHGTSPTHYRLLRHHRKNKTVLVDENIKRIQI